VKLICAVIILLCALPLRAGKLLINEISCSGSGGDWAELFFYSDVKEKMEISGLYVTMYYGKSEPLSSAPVTIYSYDRPETPYDDRFVVVHLSGAAAEDETDITGDTNRNGYIDLYTNNLSGGLWNTDCVIAIDTDDNPANGGIIDFAAFSNRDGAANESMASFVRSAQAMGQWAMPSGDNIQSCMIDIGPKGLSPYMSIARKNANDTNSSNDFAVSKFQTPGRPNILSDSQSGPARLIRAEKNKITMIPGHPVLGTGNIGLFVYEPCSLRLRIFSDIGIPIYESHLMTEVYPGRFTIKWDHRGRGRIAATGLYIGIIEASSSSLRRTESEKIYIILSRYR
jgi:hypothetical protein